jgi:hypothetical protein
MTAGEVPKSLLVHLSHDCTKDWRTNSSSTPACSISDDLVQVVTAHSPFWPVLGKGAMIMTCLFLQKFWVLLVVGLLEAVMWELAVSMLAVRIKGDVGATATGLASVVPGLDAIIVEPDSRGEYSLVWRGRRGLDVAGIGIHGHLLADLGNAVLAFDIRRRRAFGAVRDLAGKAGLCLQ